MSAPVQRPGRAALVVEKDRRESELGAAMLREFDLAVTQVQSAEEAIGVLCERPNEVGVVLADVKLSGAIDGLGLARRVSVLWPSISLILTSDEPGVAAERLPARATYVPKPWRGLDIVSAAERAARADHSVRAVVL